MGFGGDTPALPAGQPTQTPAPPPLIGQAAINEAAGLGSNDKWNNATVEDWRAAFGSLYPQHADKADWFWNAAQTYPNVTNRFKTRLALELAAIGSVFGFGDASQGNGLLWLTVDDLKAAYPENHTTTPTSHADWEKRRQQLIGQPENTIATALLATQHYRIPSPIQSLMPIPDLKALAVDEYIKLIQALENRMVQNGRLQEADKTPDETIAAIRALGPKPVAPPSASSPSGPTSQESGIQWFSPVPSYTGIGYVFNSCVPNYGRHSGIDFGAPHGTPIYAAANGKVIVKGNNEELEGHYILIQHDNGFFTLYCHMNQTSPFNVNDTVQGGQQIGEVGETGLAFGPHLHFEVRFNARGPGNSINAWSYFFPTIPEPLASPWCN